MFLGSNRISGLQHINQYLPLKADPIRLNRSVVGYDYARKHTKRKYIKLSAPAKDLARSTTMELRNVPSKVEALCTGSGRAALLPVEKG